MRLEKVGKTIHANGEKEIVYDVVDQDNKPTGIKIESRKQAIPHANRSGFWFHTTFFVIGAGGVSECPSLARAKTLAEYLLIGKEKQNETT